MRFREWRIENGELRMGRNLLELTIENGELTIGKEVVILSGVKNLFSVILSLGKNLKGFREVGGIYEI